MMMNLLMRTVSLLADDDGDHIVISTDEELVDALDQFDGSVFRLYLKSEWKRSHRSSSITM